MNLPILNLTQPPILHAGRNGWGVGYPTDEIMEWAEQRRRYGDLHKPNEMPDFSPPEQRRQGFVAEGMFNAWLSRLGVSFVHHGGADGLPDFEVKDVPVAIRCTATKRPQFEPWMLAYIFEEHLRYSQALRFFLGYEEATGAYVFLGAITYRDFIACATVCKKGDEPCRGFTAKADMRVVKLDVLTRPGPWLAGLTALAQPATR